MSDLQLHAGQRLLRHLVVKAQRIQLGRLRQTPQQAATSAASQLQDGNCLAGITVQYKGETGCGTPQPKPCQPLMLRPKASLFASQMTTMAEPDTAKIHQQT
jgi:hypothetical protein